MPLLIRRAGRARRVVLALAMVAASHGVMVMGEARPAAAHHCDATPRTCHHGSTTPNGVTAGAALRLAAGGGSSTPIPCLISVHHGPGGPDHWHFFNPPLEGHYEWRVTPALGADAPPGSSDVWVYCVSNDRSGPVPPDGWPEEFLRTYRSVPPMTAEDLVEHALAQLELYRGTVHTSPGEGLASLAGMDTWLILDEGAWDAVYPPPVTDGTNPVLAVQVWALPDPASTQVTWNTGEGRVSCEREAEPGTCTYAFQRSSLGQPGQDSSGRPAYSITASANYIGGYAVYIDGVYVGGQPNLGSIVRTSVPYLLPVEEAQALNTGAS